MDAIELTEADERENLIAQAKDLALIDFVNLLILDASDLDDGGKRNGEEASAPASTRRTESSVLCVG